MPFTWKKAPGVLYALPAVLALACVLSTSSSAQAAEPSVAFSADGIVQSNSGGFMFPDGTLQETAAGAATTQDLLDAIRHQSVNQGIYDNRISDFTHDRAFVEICFKAGTMKVDEDDADTSTTGGNCDPGDVGWVIERTERTTATWTDAKATCLEMGMRLPEPFEYQLTCDNAAMIGIIDMTDNYEWASNSSIANYLNQNRSFAATLGGGSCNYGSTGAVAGIDGTRTSKAYRCGL